MPVTLSIKNVPESLLELLRARAKRNHRSLQGELLATLEETVSPKRRLTIDEAYEMAQSLRLPSRDDATRVVREDRDAR